MTDGIDNADKDRRIESAWDSLSGGEPPADLDRRILAEARAVAAHRRRRATIGRWAGSVALAASVVLGISLTWNVMLEDRAMPPSTDSSGPVRLEEAPATPERKSTAPTPEPEAPRPAREQDASTGAAAETQELERVRVTGSRIRGEEREASTNPESDALDTELMPSPGEWLDDIRALREAGHHDEADRSLLLFQRTYPDYPLRPTTETPSEPENR